MSRSHPERSEGVLVLVVEDEPFLLMTYEDALTDAGARYLSASSVGEALSLLTLDVDVAILDIRLGDEKVFPVAYRLMEEGIPFLFCSGTGGDMPEGMFSQAPLIPKPANAALVVGEAIALARRAGLALTAG
jgi:DNA-binding response OmpR family regulator